MVTDADAFLVFQYGDKVLAVRGYMASFEINSSLDPFYRDQRAAVELVGTEVVVKDGNLSDMWGSASEGGSPMTTPGALPAQKESLGGY